MTRAGAGHRLLARLVSAFSLPLYFTERYAPGERAGWAQRLGQDASCRGIGAWPMASARAGAGHRLLAGLVSAFSLPLYIMTRYSPSERADWAQRLGQNAGYRGIGAWPMASARAGAGHRLLARLVISAFSLPLYFTELYSPGERADWAQRLGQDASCRGIGAWPMASARTTFGGGG